MTKLIIKGAIYSNGDELLRPRYTGNFHTVDCNAFKTKKDIKADYSNDFYKEAIKEQPLIYDGVKYYPCEGGPYHTESMELLSDLRELNFFDDNINFD
jgi:hypothetical protein